MNKYFFLLIFTLDLLLFYPIFSIFFAADDFYVLNQVQVNNITEFLKLFLPIKEVVYYRPLGIQFYFFIIRKIFGLNPFIFHLISFIFHFLNTVLIYKIAHKLSKNEIIAYLTCFFWSTSAIHYLSLAWAVNFSFILVTLFYFLTILFWLKSGKIKSYLTFFLGVFSSEMILTLPLFLFFYELIIKKSKLKIIFKKISPFLIIIFFYFLIRLFFPGKYEGVYIWEFNRKILSTFRWYIMWAFGWAETMKDQMINFYSIRDEFYLSFFNESLIFINSFFIIIGLFIFLPTAFLLLQKLHKVMAFFKQNFSLLILATLIFFLSLLPVLFTPNHIYPHYLTIASFGIYFSLTLFYIKIFRWTKKEKWLEYFFILLVSSCWLLVSYTTVNLDQKVHWLPRHALLAKEF